MLSENYKKYFKMMMDKHGIKSLDQLSSEEKKRFKDYRYAKHKIRESKI